METTRKFVRIIAGRQGYMDNHAIDARMTEVNAWIQVTVKSPADSEAFADKLESDFNMREIYVKNAYHILSDPEMTKAAWLPGNIEQAIKRSQRGKRSLREIILDILSESTGVRSNQFVVDVISYVRDNGIDCEFTTENLIIEIDALINDGLIMEIDYVVPASNYRIRSLLLPKDSQIINITNHGQDDSVFLPISKHQFEQLLKATDIDSLNVKLFIALKEAADKVAKVLESRNLASDGEK